MRPDEHKKKKNQQYKKKHGISDKESKPDVNSKSATHDKKEKHSNVQKDSKNVELEVEKSKDEVPEAAGRKHFGKRKIVSNWSRYEDSSDSEGEDGIPRQRGEDFNKLLAEAGGSATQFRLKDEEDWAEDSQVTVAPTLALDFENLSETLSCIPLNERLGISESMFSEDQRCEIRAHCAEAKKKLKTTMEDKPVIIKTDEKVKGFIRSEKTDTVISNPVNKSVSSAILVKEKSGSENFNDLPKPNNDVTEHKQTSKEKNVNVKSDVGKSLHEQPADNFKSKEVSSLEDDLDMILSLGESIDKNAEHVNTAHRDFKAIPEKTEDKKTTNKPKEVKTSAKGDENLEDWLDAMLDD